MYTQWSGCTHVFGPMQVLSYWQWQRTCPSYRAALTQWLQDNVAVVDPTGGTHSGMGHVAVCTPGCHSVTWQAIGVAVGPSKANH